MKKLLLGAVLSTVLLLAACGSSEEESSVEKSEKKYPTSSADANNPNVEKNYVKPNQNVNSSKSEEIEVEEDATEIESSKLNLDDYKEADLYKLHDNGYEKQTELKVSDAEVISITPNDDGVGNMVVAHVDNIPVILDDMIGYDLTLNDYYTFYGPPNMEDGLILIEYEESDFVPTDEDVEETTDKNEEFTIKVEGVELTVNDAYYTDERNTRTQLDIVADQVLMVDMTFTNYTGGDYSPNHDIDIYADGLKVEKYPAGDISLDMVSDGRSANAIIAYAIVGQPEVIELEYAPLFSESRSREVIDITPH